MNADNPVERLCHFSEKSFGDVDCILGGKVGHRVSQVLLDPLGQLAPFVPP